MTYDEIRLSTLLYCLFGRMRKNDILMVSFQIKNKEYLSIKRSDEPYKTIELIPDTYHSYKNDICPYDDSGRQLVNHFYARTYSDDSILLFLISDRKNMLEAKKRKISIIELLND